MSLYREVLLASYGSGGYAASNPDDAVSARVRRENYHRQFREMLPPCKDAKILDLGCGSGFLVEFLKEDGYADVTGVDASKEQVARAQQKGLPVLHGDAVHYLTQSDRYDVIFNTDFIEHLTKDEIVDFLTRIRKALKPGGYVVIQTPNASSIYGMTARYQDFTHETAFTGRSLEQVLVACDFNRIMVRDNSIPFGFRPRRLLRWYLSQILRLAQKLLFSIEVGMDRPKLFGKLLIAKAYKPLG